MVFLFDFIHKIFDRFQYLVKRTRIDQTASISIFCLAILLIFQNNRRNLKFEIWMEERKSVDFDRLLKKFRHWRSHKKHKKHKKHKLCCFMPFYAFYAFSPWCVVGGPFRGCAVPRSLGRVLFWFFSVTWCGCVAEYPLRLHFWPALKFLITLPGVFQLLLGRWAIWYGFILWHRRKW